MNIATCNGGDCWVKECCLRYNKRKEVNEIKGTSDYCGDFLRDITTPVITGFN